MYLHRRCDGLFRQRFQEVPAVGVREEDGATGDAAQNRMHWVTGGNDPGVSRHVETLTAAMT